jgi:hypothetical protein
MHEWPCPLPHSKSIVPSFIKQRTNPKNVLPPNVSEWLAPASWHRQRLHSKYHKNNKKSNHHKQQKPLHGIVNHHDRNDIPVVTILNSRVFVNS